MITVTPEVAAKLDYVEINRAERRFIFINPNDPAHKVPSDVLPLPWERP